MSTSLEWKKFQVTPSKQDLAKFTTIPPPLSFVYGSPPGSFTEFYTEYEPKKILST